MIEPSDTSAAPSREEADFAAPLQSEEEQGKAADKGNSARGSVPPRNAAIPDPEVPALPKRRRFPADYKARIVEEPAAYLVDVDSYEFMQHRLQILEGIARGERAILENRTFSQAEARKKMKKWLV